MYPYIIEQGLEHLPGAKLVLARSVYARARFSK